MGGFLQSTEATPLQNIRLEAELVLETFWADSEKTSGTQLKRFEAWAQPLNWESPTELKQLEIG
jgi:hypothetical protein